MSSIEEQAKTDFGKRNYKMSVVKNMGVFRVLDFKHENRHDGSFTITTWPNHLCFSGDMGTFVFSRIYDMINFFKGSVNLCYWSEKVVSSSTFGSGIKRFSVDLFKNEVLEFKETLTAESVDIEDSFDRLDDVEDIYSAVEFVRSFHLDSVTLNSSFPDEYTFHYAFACFAINFACNEYLNSKTSVTISNSLSKLSDHEINLKVAEHFFNDSRVVTGRFGDNVLVKVYKSGAEPLIFNPCDSWDNAMELVENIGASIIPVCNLAYIEDENEVRVLEVESHNVKRAISELYLLSVDEGFAP